MLIVLTTTPNADEAESLANKIVDSRLAACVQILPQMQSVYIWEGKVQAENEYLVLIKTSETKYAKLEKFIIENHTYEVPEVVAVKPSNISAKYLAWMNDYLDSVE